MNLKEYHMKRHYKKIFKRIQKMLLQKKFEGAKLGEMTFDGHIISLEIFLPEHKDLWNLEQVLPNIQQELSASDYKIHEKHGKRIVIHFGMNQLEKTYWENVILRPNTLKLEFPSAYGSRIIDFQDSSSCHMLNGGVTRMGKTVFLMYLATVLYLQNHRNIKIYINSAKIKDFYPFMGVRNVEVSEDVKDALSTVMKEYKERKALLHSPELREATDAKSVREKYPEYADKFNPIFIIIDEYARYADDQKVQKMVTELVETAGFLSIHLIIASQRPDVSTVLKSRIRANLLTRLAFTTADGANSKIIIDRLGAERLGMIPGRGILIDGEATIVQVPYLLTSECDKLLEPYRMENQNETKGHGNTEIFDQIQSVQQESTSLPSLQEQQQPGECNQQNTQTYEFEWFNKTNT